MAGEKQALGEGGVREEDRYGWVDIARGMGIVAVVAGHVWPHGLVHQLAYSFHMPLFFLLSGYLFRPQPPLPFARRQIAAQGLSYIAYLALLVLADILIEQGRGHRPIFSHWPADLLPVLMGGSALRGPFTIFWFVPCLLAARILFNLIAVRAPDPLGRVWWVLAPFILMIGVAIGLWTDVSPLGLLTVPVALFLLWAGAAGRMNEWRDWMLWMLLPLSLAGLFWFPAVNMKAGDYGWPLLSLAGAIATSALIFRLSRLPFPGATLWRTLGRASLVIMYLHVAFVHYLTPLMGKGAIFAIAICIPYACYWLFGQSRLTSRLFLNR